MLDPQQEFMAVFVAFVLIYKGAPKLSRLLTRYLDKTPSVNDKGELVNL